MSDIGYSKSNRYDNSISYSGATLVRPLFLLVEKYFLVCYLYICLKRYELHM